VNIEGNEVQAEGLAHTVQKHPAQEKEGRQQNEEEIIASNRELARRVLEIDSDGSSSPSSQFRTFAASFQNRKTPY